MLTKDEWITWGIPAIALLLGVIAVLAAILMSRAFDRRYGASAASEDSLPSNSHWPAE
jgi:cytochrome c-type biogenesis protein CcmH/NrfF